MTNFKLYSAYGKIILISKNTMDTIHSANQNECGSGLYPLSGIVKTRKHNVS
jgi:hypothetical protein